MKARIEIDTHTFVRFWLVVIGFLLAGFFVYSAFTAFVIIFMSIFLAIALSPPVNKLASILPGKSRIAGTAIAYVAIIGILGGFTFLVVPPIVEQTARFVQTVPDIAQSITDEWGGIDGLIDNHGLRTQYEQALATVEVNASQWASNLGSTLLTGANSLAVFTVALLITLVMTFFMLVEGPTWVRRIWKVYADTDKMEHHREVATKLYKVVTSYVNGQLLIAFIASVSASLTVFLLSFVFDLPSNLAIPIAAIVFVGSLIPMFGATIAGAIVTLLLLFNDPWAAVVFLVYFIIYVQVENNVLTTIIQAKTLDLSPLLVLVAATVGTYFIGLAGGIISIPIAGCIKVLVQEYFERQRIKREHESKPIAKLAKKLKGEA